jgi:hypothetical protein
LIHRAGNYEAGWYMACLRTCSFLFPKSLPPVLAASSDWDGRLVFFGAARVQKSVGRSRLDRDVEGTVRVHEPDR